MSQAVHRFLRLFDREQIAASALFELLKANDPPNFAVHQAGGSSHGKTSMLRVQAYAFADRWLTDEVLQREEAAQAGGGSPGQHDCAERSDVNAAAQPEQRSRFS